MDAITITVDGKPESQGSKTPVRRGAKIMLIEGTGDKPKRLNTWRNSIRAGLPQVEVPFEDAVKVALVFRFDRPKSVPVSKRRHMTVKPDVDKLARAVLDSLTFNGETGVLKDDCRVVSLTAHKEYVVEGGESQGVSIWIESVTE